MDDDVRSLIGATAGTDVGPEDLWEACRAVLLGGGNGRLVAPDDLSVTVRIDVERTTWRSRCGIVGEAATLPLALALAASVGRTEVEIEEASAEFDEARARRWLNASMPESMLDAHWYTRRLRARCIAHGSDRCTECPPPTGFRRSYGVWVAPHPDWPGPARGIWRHN